MRFIVKKHFTGKTVSGYRNLHVGDVCEMDESGWICKDGKRLAYKASQNGTEYFVRDDDGRGLERAELVKKITDKLLMRDPKKNKNFDQGKCLKDPVKYGKFVIETEEGFNKRQKYNDHVQERWNKIWEDESLRRFKKEPDGPNHWLWNVDFFNANIEDLEYIYNLVKE